MRIAIISDIHYGEGEQLGKINPETRFNTRLEAIDKTFNTFIDYVINPTNKISVVVIGGDIFKSRKPTPTQQLLFTKALIRILEHNKTAEKPLKVVIFTGNHDIQKSELAHSISTVAVITSLYEKTFWIEDIPKTYVFKEDDEKVLLCTIPYLYRQKLEMGNNQQVVEFYKTLAQEALKKHSDATCKVFCGHQTVEGCHIAEYDDINSFNEIIVPQDAFEGYDFVSQGHIHKFQVISKQPLIVYQGNPIQLDFAHSPEKGFIVYDTQLKKYKRVLLANTKFVKLELDCSETEEDATSLIIEHLKQMQEEIYDTIFKIKTTIKERDLPIRMKEIKPLIENVHFFAPLEKTIIRPNRARSEEMIAGKSLKELLEAVAVSRDYSDKEKEFYINNGLAIAASLELKH